MTQRFSSLASSSLAIVLSVGLVAAVSTQGCAAGEEGPESQSSFVEESEVQGCTLSGETPYQDSGKWGEVGIWCDAEAMETFYPGVVEQIGERYGSLVIPARESSWEVRRPIIANVVKTVVVSAHIALEQRGLRTQWSAEEIDAFTHASVAMANQESGFSHYKIIDDKIRLMRGDAGHSHGMLQIHDRWHHEAVFEGDVGWDILHNLNYGIHFYLEKWLAAKEAFSSGSADCIGSGGALDYIALSRSAYAAYNSGNVGKACRWTDESDPWAANDKGFGARLEQIYGDEPAQLGWVLSYPEALDGLDDIDFTANLNLPMLPGDVCDQVPYSKSCNGGGGGAGGAGADDGAGGAGGAASSSSSSSSGSASSTSSSGSSSSSSSGSASSTSSSGSSSSGGSSSSSSGGTSSSSSSSSGSDPSGGGGMGGGGEGNEYDGGDDDWTPSGSSNSTNGSNEGGWDDERDPLPDSDPDWEPEAEAGGCSSSGRHSDSDGPALALLLLGAALIRRGRRG
jgi:hypothetical protein